jgi:hypothetical protein
MSRKRPREIDVTEPLRDSEKWGSSVQWPAAIDMRLDGLVDLARDAGDSLSRGELLGALVLSAPTDGNELSRLLRIYRTSPAGAALIRRPGEPDPKVIVLAERKPGRR